ncbi:MAG: AarF/ABC1/UbiB kinase family protein [Sandaracinaceae bacterium]|nr:AarF/ABC1/UbiB kinase family protein [Sandaracinaceae bacterium]
MPKRPSNLRAAWTATRLAGRRLVGRRVSERDLALGELLTGQLDEMKGLAMKIGQIVSYLDVPLPDEVQEKLARLQTGVVGMPAAQVREVVEGALGDTLEGAFEAFAIEPVAAASIGEVHRARVAGREVAVKVQYPDVSGSFAADLGSLGRVASLASLASAVDGRAIVRELSERLEEECDYPREAEMQRAFAARFANDPRVVVPEVIRSHTAGPVLTSEWIDGDGFAALCRSDDAARKDAAAEALIRFTYECLLGWGTIQADPHPGNFLFLEDGRVAFLDFGCVRELDASFVDGLRAMTRAIRDGDRAAFAASVRDLGLVGDPKRFDYDHFYRVMEHLHRPFLVERFTITREFVAEGHALNGPTSPNARTLSMPPAYVWVARLQWGLWSILARLGASGSFGGILDDALSGRRGGATSGSMSLAAPLGL